VNTLDFDILLEIEYDFEKIEFCGGKTAVVKADKGFI